MDRVFDALVTAAAADIARHGFADLVVGGLWIFHQQRGGLHDLAGLAVAALRDVDLAPGLLHRVIAAGMQPFDGGDLAVADVGHRGDAGAHRLLADQNRAGAAQRLAAAELGAGQSDFVAEIPEQGKIRIAFPVLFPAVDLHLDHDGSSLFISYGYLFDVSGDIIPWRSTPSSR